MFEVVIYRYFLFYKVFGGKGIGYFKLFQLFIGFILDMDFKMLNKCD